MLGGITPLMMGRRPPTGLEELQTTPYTYSSRYSALLTGADGDGAGMRDGTNIGNASNYGSAGGGAGVEFLMTDLGEIKTVTKVVIRPMWNGASGGWSYSYSHELRIKTSTDGVSFTQRAMTSITSDGDTPYTYTINQLARYVRLDRNPGDTPPGGVGVYVAVGEFQVWALDL
jgi:hypothetical protein